MGQHIQQSITLASAQPMFLVGRDVEKHWLAVDTLGRSGSLFTSQEAALRYATFESDHRSGAVRRTEEPIALSYATSAARA